MIFGSDPPIIHGFKGTCQTYANMHGGSRELAPLRFDYWARVAAEVEATHPRLWYSLMIFLLLDSLPARI